MAAPPDRLSSSLERVLNRFAERVRLVGSRYRLHGDDLDELFQQVRIRLWQAQRDADTIEAAPASYVYRTAVTAALDLIRRRQAKREVALERPAGDEGSLTTDAMQAPSIEDTLGEAELATRVARALERVMASRRPVVRMYLAGYKPDEIAATFGWTTVNTRNLLYRGLADLRTELAADGMTCAEDAWTL
ncbi:MAG: sigma-70 family RNA polymerase sigma factor [Gemmatimonadetes bacterium]|nr:sigma-70 family RNA polymerase sigma factor [Gemmatimonadota bacterium]